MGMVSEVYCGSRAPPPSLNTSYTACAMRRAQAHVCALLAVLVLLAPAAPVAEGQPADVFWNEGHALVRRGSYADAQALYASVAARFPDGAPRARLLQARAALAGTDTDTAEALIQQVLAEHPGAAET